MKEIIGCPNLGINPNTGQEDNCNGFCVGYSQMWSAADTGFGATSGSNGDCAWRTKNGQCKLDNGLLGLFKRKSESESAFMSRNQAMATAVTNAFDCFCKRCSTVKDTTDDFFESTVSKTMTNFQAIADTIAKWGTSAHCQRFHTRQLPSPYGFILTSHHLPPKLDAAVETMPRATCGGCA